MFISSLYEAGIRTTYVWLINVVRHNISGVWGSDSDIESDPHICHTDIRRSWHNMSTVWGSDSDIESDMWVWQTLLQHHPHTVAVRCAFVYDTCLIRMCDMTQSYVIQMCVAEFYGALQCVAVRCAFVYHTCLCQDTVKSRTDSLWVSDSMYDSLCKA